MTRLLPLTFLIMASLPASAGYIVIDDFIMPQSVTLTGVAPQTGGSVANPTVAALGVERDLWVKKTTGPNGAPISALVNPYGQNLMRFDMGAGVRGSARLTWDGIDGNANTIDYDGLGGVDLGLSGSSYFELRVAFSNIAGPVDFVVYDASDATGSQYAKGTISLPAGIDLDPDVDTLINFQLPFSSMLLMGGATTDLFRHVGAITMTINAEVAGQGGRDVNLDRLRVYADIPLPPPVIPEPATLALLGLGLGLIGLSRRSKR